MTTSRSLLNQFSLESLEQSNPDYEYGLLSNAVLAIESKTLNHALIDLNDISVESFFTVLKNRFFLGSAGSYSAGLAIPRREIEYLGLNTDYAKVRTKPIVVPPGFNGNLYEYVYLLGTIVRNVFPEIFGHIATARALTASLINGDEQWNSVSKLDTIPEPFFDIKVRDKMKSFFKPNLINEQLFGKVFRNAKEYGKTIDELYLIEQDLRSYDFFEVQKLSNSIDNHMKALGSISSNRIGAKPLAQLVAYIQSVAIAVELTSVIPNSMRELVTAANTNYQKIL